MFNPEILTLIFNDGFEYTWTIKPGFKGIRDAKKVSGFQKKHGDPIKIEGEGYIANLLRKEYKLYNQDKDGYEGISTKDILIGGAKITGVPVEKLSSAARKIEAKLNRKKIKRKSIRKRLKQKLGIK